VSAASIFVVATARDSIANFLSALLTVYIILIFAYILMTLAFSFGARVPYARWSSAVIGFLRDVVEPYLAIFRRFIPPIGPVDVSPIIAILVLQIGGGLLIGVIRG
jgi:uncharacterized protein YggT (Ycf19 family)